MINLFQSLSIVKKRLHSTSEKVANNIPLFLEEFCVKTIGIGTFPSLLYHRASFTFPSETSMPKVSFCSSVNFLEIAESMMERLLNLVCWRLYKILKYPMISLLISALSSNLVPLVLHIELILALLWKFFMALKKNIIF